MTIRKVTHGEGIRCDTNVQAHFYSNYLAEICITIPHTIMTPDQLPSWPPKFANPSEMQNA